MKLKTPYSMLLDVWKDFFKTQILGSVLKHVNCLVQVILMTSVVRLHFVKKLKEDLQQRCGSDFPPVFAEATCLLNASAWKFDNFFRAVNSSGKLCSQFQVTPVYNLNVENLVSDIGIKTQN